MATKQSPITVGVLALQGAFVEHLRLLNAASQTPSNSVQEWNFLEVRHATELAQCDALIIPGGESTTMALVAERSNILEPLREFVKVLRNPTFGTCAGLILLSESANRTKRGGQDLVGGLDVRVNRNHFGRQVESFEAPLDLPFLASADPDKDSPSEPFRGIFIRAPVVEKLLPNMSSEQVEEGEKPETVIAPSLQPKGSSATAATGQKVEVMGILPGRADRLSSTASLTLDESEGDIVAVRQGNVFGTSFHPELTGDARIHAWWLAQVRASVLARRNEEPQSKDSTLRWLVDTRELWNGESLPADLLGLLPAATQRSILAYVQHRDQKHSLASHLLKYAAVAKLLHIPWSDVTLTASENKKPIYQPPSPDAPTLDFNISHQAGLVALVADTGRDVKVGVDIVCVGERNEIKEIKEVGVRDWVKMYEDVFSDADLTSILNEAESSKADEVDTLRLFYTYWALKEAYLKMTGDALLAPWLREVEFRRVRAPLPRGSSEYYDLSNPDEAPGTPWGDTLHDVEVWRNGCKVQDTYLWVGAWETEYIIAVAVEGRADYAGPVFETVDVERNIRPLAK